MSCLYRVNTAEPVVALTIDDGPDPDTTPSILDLLAEHDARSTFFLLTDRIAGQEAIVTRLVSEGHELGNHLTRDRRSILLRPARFTADLRAAHAILTRFGPVRWFRPGGGWHTRRMLDAGRDLGYRCVLGSVYPADPHIRWVGFMVRHVMASVRPGSIIILHDGGARGRRTIAALARILPALARRGLRVTTVSDLETLHVDEESPNR